MYTHILIATDGSELAEKGLDHGFDLARRLGSKVTVVTVTELDAGFVVDPFTGFSGSAELVEELQKVRAQEAKAILARAKEKADKIGIEIETVHVPNHPPFEGIIGAADERGANLIVLASHGRRGLGRLLLGSQATQVLVHAKVPVLVIR